MRFSQCFCGFVLLAVLSFATPLSRSALAQEASSAVYMRTDTDHTTVVSPRVRIADTFADTTRVDLVYSADVWTSASIDIVTSASKAVTEQRDELNATVQHEFEDGALQVAYRYSIEPDYRSHGMTLGGSRDFASKSTIVAATLGVMVDRVGRSGDPTFDRDLHTFNLGASGTQIIDPLTWVQLVYEVSYANGFLSSPYRFVGVGNASKSCRPAGAVCVPESLPDERFRHAIALGARRALSERWALGGSYRFYVDDWALLAHTLSATLSFMPAGEVQLTLEYRGYAQSAASYYQAQLRSLADVGTFVTRDKELSPFMSHRMLLSATLEKHLGGASKVRLGLLLGPTLYVFSDFFAYDHLLAGEATVALGADL